MPQLDDLASQCIRCGFCLESCPTFLITGDESQSPRGRITLAKEAHAAESFSPSTVAALDTCLGCRACETACPSGVQYGKIIEIARDEIAGKNKFQKRLINSITNPTLARFQFALGGLLPSRKPPALLSKLLSGQLPEADTPQLPAECAWPALEESSLPPIKGQVYLLEGCVMRVLYPEVNEATKRLLRRVGIEVVPTKSGCCGALHAHSGYLADAEDRAQALATSMPDDLPVIVNSAGCGSTIKEYGSVVGEGLAEFGRRTFDATEFLHQHGLIDQLKLSRGLIPTKVTYHEACHLVHGQKISSIPKELISAIPGVNLVPFAEADVCCGSAGTYNVFQPKMARQLLDRKWANVASTGAQILATGNPGCHAWIEQANREHDHPIRVLHTLELLESSFSGLRE